MEDVKESRDDSNVDEPKSSGSKDLSNSLPEEAFNNFIQGKRHMLVHDYSFAVQSLAIACELYVKHFGELAIECGEVYFLYGKALFRLSQQQAGVLAIGSNEETTSESEKENESEEKENSEGEGEEAEGEDEENETEEGDENETENCVKEEKEPSESTDSPPAVDESGSETKSKVEPPESADGMELSCEKESKVITSESDPTAESEESKKEETDEDTQETGEGDLELAWNTLETAKLIFKREGTVEAQLKVAEILQLLGEISMETDNNIAAIIDFKECLEIQKKHLQPDDRILAESYYQMGLALMLEKKYPEALENFRTTKHILELRIENLKNKPVNDKDGTFASADIEAEISNLKEVLVDIKEKIDDTEQLMTDQKKEMAEFLLNQPGSSSISNEKDQKSTTSKPVSNITHLLKRKKPDEGTTEDSAKRIKTSGVVNDFSTKIN